MPGGADVIGALRKAEGRAVRRVRSMAKPLIYISLTT
jgi:hypothetical protein